MELIEIKSGKITFSDPCYGLNTWCMIKDFPFPNGKYRVHCVKTTRTDNWGLRVKELIIYNIDKVPENEGREMDIFWDELPNDIGVDSGQAGIFDSKYYEKYHGVEDVNDDWYDKVGQLTLRAKSYGTTENQGVCSRAGFGDGSYTAYIGKLGSDIVAAKIEFISDEELDNTEENWFNVEKELEELESEKLEKQLKSEFSNQTEEFIATMKDIINEIKKIEQEEKIEENKLENFEKGVETND